jgi:predicted nucleotidyltransferase component of viral defense system
MIPKTELIREAETTGFQPESLERVAHLFQILESLRSHPFLKERLALKGGTALNAFVLRVPRLSVDIDLNYIGSGDREVMLSEKPKIEQAMEAVCSRLGILARRMPTEHAGGKWQLSYLSYSGRSMSLEIDLNFLLRTPLWPITVMDSQAIGSFKAERVPVVDIHELAAGKLAALFSRNAGRDLYDVRNLFAEMSMDQKRLRLGFVVYGGASRTDWRTITLKHIMVNSGDIGTQLVPMLQRNLAPARTEIDSWSKKLLKESRELLSDLLPLRTHEMEFLTRLNEAGEIVPELLTDEAGMGAIIGSHPALLWKAQNVREYLKRKK